jgi:hypothetical protein
VGGRCNLQFSASLSAISVSLQMCTGW